MPQAHSKHADAIATLTLKVDVPDEADDLRILKKTLQATVVDLLPIGPLDEQDWRSSIIEKLKLAISNYGRKSLKIFWLLLPSRH